MAKFGPGEENKAKIPSKIIAAILGAGLGIGALGAYLDRDKPIEKPEVVTITTTQGFERKIRIVPLHQGYNTVGDRFNEGFLKDMDYLIGGTIMIQYNNQSLIFSPFRIQEGINPGEMKYQMTVNLIPSYPNESNLPATAAWLGSIHTTGSYLIDIPRDLVSSDINGNESADIRSLIEPVLNGLESIGSLQTPVPALEEPGVLPESAIQGNLKQLDIKERERLARQAKDEKRARYLSRQGPPKRNYRT